MDSVMMEIETKWEVLVERDCYHNYGFTPMVRCKIDDDRVWEWIRDDLMNHMDLTDEEERNMGLSQYVDRIVAFEVEVEYVGNKAIGATCQTECPNFVKGWVEKEAMKQYNQEKGTPCTS